MSDLQEAIAAVKARRGGAESAAEPAEATTDAETQPEPSEAQESAAATEPVAEPAAPEPPATPTTRDSRAISEWAALELRNRREQQRLEQERSELASLKAEAEKAASLLRLAKEDPRAFFAESGLSVDELTKAVLEGRKADPHAGRIEALEKELQNLREARETETKAQAQARIDRAMAAEREALSSWVAPRAAEYPHLMAIADGKAEVVAEAIQEIRLRHYNSTAAKTGRGEVLDEAKVAGMLEQTWRDRIQRAATRIGSGQSDAAPAPETSGKPPATIGRKHATRTKPKDDAGGISGRDRALARIKAAKQID